MAKPVVKRVLRKGNKGIAVKKLQRALNQRFKNKHKVDGIFGTKTRRRVRNWQKKNKQTVDGIVGKATWRSLGYNLKQPPGKVTLANGAKPAGDALMNRLRQVARDIGKEIRVISGDRTPYQAWTLRMRYLNGTGNLAARCCTRYSGKHSWSACGKNPTSNHARGRAVDCGVMNPGYRSIGYYQPARNAMRKRGLCLPVGGEPWHVERGGNWRA